MFIQGIKEALISGNAVARDLDDTEELSKPAPHGVIGFKDTKYYYFLPKESYRLVAEGQRRIGLEFPGNERALWQRLKE